MTQQIKELEDEKKEDYYSCAMPNCELDPAKCPHINKMRGWNDCIDHLTPIVQKLIEQAKCRKFHVDLQQGLPLDVEELLKQAKQEGRNEAVDYLGMKLDGLTVLKKDKEFIYTAFQRAREGKSISNPYNPKQ